MQASFALKVVRDREISDNQKENPSPSRLLCNRRPQGHEELTIRDATYLSIYLDQADSWPSLECVQDSRLMGA